MDESFDIRELLAALRRRWVLIAATTAIGAAIAVLAALLPPPVYSSAARVLVESQTIPSDLARSTVAVGVSERIASIQQRLTTRQNLLDLAQRYDVFRGRTDLSATEIVERMRAATRIQSLGASTQRRARADTTVQTIEISFRADRPQVAAQVANEFLTQLLEQNVEQRSARASETLDFFTSEVERLSAELLAAEAEISAYKTENALAVPDSVAFRRDELATLQRENVARDARRVLLLQSKRSLEEAIALGRTPPADVAALSPEARELVALRATLAQQRGVYAESHPSVRALAARIAALESVVTAAAPAPASDAATAAAASGATGQATETVRQLEQIEAEIALIDEQTDAAAARIVQLSEALARAPEVEITLGALTRRYASLQAQHQQVVLKQVEAATGERLEVNQQAERLQVIEQPQAPEAPVAPNRILIAGAGSVLSLGLGLGLALLAEMMNRSIRTPRDLERALELRPVVAIPYIRTTAETARRRWSLRMALFCLLVLLPLALYLVDRQVAPLPVLLDTALRTLGLDEWRSLIERRLAGG